MKYMICYLIATLLSFIIINEAFPYPITVDKDTGVFTDSNTGYKFLQMDRYMYTGGMTLLDYVKNNKLHLATAKELAVLFVDIGSTYEHIIPAYDIGYTMSTGVSPTPDHGPTWFMSHGYYDAGNGLFGQALFSTTLNYSSTGVLINSSNSWEIDGPYGNPTQPEWFIGTWIVESMPDPVPEPSTFLLFSFGLIGICFIRRINRKNILCSPTSGQINTWISYLN